MQEDIDKFKEVYDLIVTFFVTYSFQLLGALIILIIGLLISNRLARLVLAVCERHQLDITLSKFLASCTRIIIIVMVGVICLGKIGVSVTPLVAAIGAASLGAGLAVQGLLSNYGAGLNIILTRPFVVGDTISVQGVTGIVEEVRLATTILTDEDEVTITIPNRHIVGEIIHNSKSCRVVEASVGVAYDSDPETVRATLVKVLEENGVANNRQPQIGIDNFADSSINYAVRFWVPTEHFHEHRLKINDRLLDALREAGIQIPFPQREVRVLETTKTTLLN
ncbi:MAG TPA: mechanosensitive ion channel protein MscS [Porticoccaceae bacterium]|nr:mechanosensitive ion channel protein MscS [Porticoccaceae bacterium]HCO60801.1 mechanosensitive ion channel protein MscS [Porticoccaceae bacterium]